MIKKEYSEKRIVELMESTNDLKKLVEMFGVGYSEMQIASKVLIFAKKGLINKIKATMLLREYPNMIKFLSDKPKATIKLKAVKPTKQKLRT